MFKSGFVLDTDDKLHAAAHNGSIVAVWQNGKIAYYGGPIERLTDTAITIDGGTYLKDLYQFRIR